MATVKRLMRVSDNKLNAGSVAKWAAALALSSSLIGGSLLTAGCFKTNAVTRPVSIAQVDPPTTRVLTPNLYAVFDDKSRSVKSARMSPIQEQDLTALINILRQTGGDLAFGLIGESSDRPLLRLRIPAPPALPVRTKVQNPFERAEQDSLFQEQMKKYEEEQQRWETEINRRIAVFMDAVRPRLQQPARENATDIYSALERAELFLNEPGAVWPGQTHSFIILNSDGADTTKRKPVEIRSGARLLLINGSGSVGTLGSLNPLRFESKQAAFDFITAKELGRSR